jgi:HTH-type transcriptional regulator, competence development regulator
VWGSASQKLKLVHTNAFKTPPSGAFFMPFSSSPFGKGRGEVLHFADFAMFATLLNILSIVCCCFLIFANICQDNIIIMATQFGVRIRELRTKQNMLLRQLASKLDVDTSIISKVERGDRQLKKEQIPLLAEILNADKEELLMLWLADQLYNVIEGEPMADEALKSVTKKLKKEK